MLLRLEIIFSTVWLLTCRLHPKDRVGNSVIVILKDFFTLTLFYEHMIECNYEFYDSLSLICPGVACYGFHPHFILCHFVSVFFVLQYILFLPYPFSPRSIVVSVTKGPYKAIL